MIRTALCLSGQSRDFQKSFDSQKKYLLSKLEPDIFIHSWSFRGSSKLLPCHCKEYNIQDFQTHLIPENRIRAASLLELYDPKLFLIEYPNHIFFLEQINKSKTQNAKYWFNGLMMYYSIYMSNSLKKQYEASLGFTYDLVIRSRMDLYFESIDFRNTIKDAIKNNTIYLAPNENIDRPFNESMKNTLNSQGISYMPNDQFAYGNSMAMDYYSSIYTKYVENIDYAPHHGEAAMSVHLWEKNNSNFKTIKVNSGIKMKINSW
jgi:hypothetical protein